LHVHRLKVAVKNAYVFEASADKRKTYIGNETRIDLGEMEIVPGN